MSNLLEPLPTLNQRVVRINFTGFWSGFDLEQFKRVFAPLTSRYDFQISDEPEVVFQSVFGRKTAVRGRWPKAKFVFYTGENRPPKLDDFDFCLSFYRDIKDPRHLRWPLFLLRIAGLAYSIDDLINTPEEVATHERPKFCAFIQNSKRGVRNKFVRQLSLRQRVDCPGRSLNNLDLKIPHGRPKIDFLRNYRFAVCFENEATRCNEGYVTEKLIDAMLAGCIPLYWGDHRVVEDFNPRSFVNLIQFDGDMDAMVQCVLQLDGNKKKLQAIAGAPWFPNNEVPPQFQDATLREFFEVIVNQETPRRAAQSGDKATLTSGKKRIPKLPSILCHPFDEQRFVYVEIPKAGCTSVKQALARLKSKGPQPPQETSEFHDWFGYTHVANTKRLKRRLENRWRDYFTFTVVRNPIDRFESLYYEKINLQGDINAYIQDELSDDNRWLFNPHGTPQVNLIGEDLSSFDFVGRTENMEEVSARLSQTVGAEPLRHLNRSRRTARPPLSQQSLRRLTEVYRRDFEVLGYDFPRCAATST